MLACLSVFPLEVAHPDQNLRFNPFRLTNLRHQSGSFGGGEPCNAVL
jgi:hypothetical protein